MSRVSHESGGRDRSVEWIGAGIVSTALRAFEAGEAIGRTARRVRSVGSSVVRSLREQVPRMLLALDSSQTTLRPRRPEEAGLRSYSTEADMRALVLNAAPVPVPTAELQPAAQVASANAIAPDRHPSIRR